MAQLQFEFNRHEKRHERSKRDKRKRAKRHSINAVRAVKYVFTFKVVYLLISRSSRHLMCHLATRHILISRIIIRFERASKRKSNKNMLSVLVRTKSYTHVLLAGGRTERHQHTATLLVFVRAIYIFV